MNKRWRITPHDRERVERLVRGGLSPVVAQLLAARGVYTPEDAGRFLDTKLVHLRDPSELPGVPAAVERVVAAIDGGQPILVYGDYDADGMTGAAILINGLRLAGAEVSYHVPNRLTDGYGLNADAIRKYAGRGVKLIVSVDCGIASIEEAELAKELGVDLIVTDHHEFGDELPAACAIVHPRLPGTSYPFGELCGAGVAFKLAWALAQRISGDKKVTPAMRDYLMQSLSLAAIGTIADVVRLTDENRILVEHGLRMLQKSPLPGLAELMRLTKLDTQSKLTSDSVAFTLAPRLNAAGRLGQAQLAVELMTIPAGERAASLADYLNELNSSRESLQRSVLSAAQKQAQNDFDVEADPALVLAGVGWHQGVIGIVAGKLADRYSRPVFVVSMDSAGRGAATGSGRVGDSGIDLHLALGQCDEHLQRYGGHAKAAGLTIDERNLDAFRAAFCEAVTDQMSGEEIEGELRIDAETPLGQLNLDVVRQIETMAPFGEGNPRPVLASSNVELADVAGTMGGGNRHLSVRLKQGDRVVRAVAFGAAEWCDALNAVDGPIEIAYQPVINEWNGYRNVEIHLKDWRIAADTPKPFAADRAAAAPA